jgi:glycogen operon protein
MRRRWLGADDVVWLTPQGFPMTDEEWSNGARKSLMVYLSGCTIDGIGSAGEPAVDDSFVLLFNAQGRTAHFTLSGWPSTATWRVCVDTTWAIPGASRRRMSMGDRIRVRGRSVVVLTDARARRLR